MALLAAAVAFAADLVTDADLSTNVLAPTEVEVGSNGFHIRLWAAGSLNNPNASGQAVVVTKYLMAPNGTITPSANASDRVTMTFTKNVNYSQNPPCGATQAMSIRGCPNNPFVVDATLVVSPGTPDDTAGMLVVSHTGSQGLVADQTPDTGLVRVDNPPTDSTAPVITKEVTGTTGNNGWYVSDVEVAWTVSDPESAVVIDSGCGTQAFTASTSPVTSMCTAHSPGGSSTDLVTLKIDKEAPSVSCGSADGNWHAENLSIACTASDPVSGLATANDMNFDLVTDVPSDTETDDASTNLRDVVDNAGNSATAGPVAGNKVDRKAPEMSALGTTQPLTGSDGERDWWNHDVSVWFSAFDGGSGPAGSCSSPWSTTTAGEGIGVRAASGPCADAVGNVAPSIESSGYNIDKTEPALAPSVTPNPVVLNGSATASANATDSLSGVSSSACSAVDTTSVGSRTVSCFATDHAGNSASATAEYSVTYRFVGFFSPVNNNGVLNTAKAGQAIPFKWQLLDADNVPVTSLTAVSASVASLDCWLGTTADALEEYATGNSGLQNLGGGFYQWNWKSPSAYSGSCKTFKLDLGEAAPRTALFKFTK